MSGGEGGRRTPPPFLLALIVVPAAFIFLIGGGQVGLAVGMLTGAAIIVVAVRAKADGPIEVAEPLAGVSGGLLVLAISPLDDPRTAGIIASIADPSRIAAERGVSRSRQEQSARALGRRPRGRSLREPARPHRLARVPGHGGSRGRGPGRRWRPAPGRRGHAANVRGDGGGGGRRRGRGGGGDQRAGAPAGDPVAADRARAGIGRPLVRRIRT